jgi:hypothetical protein
MVSLGFRVDLKTRSSVSSSHHHRKKRAYESKISTEVFISPSPVLATGAKKVPISAPPAVDSTAVTNPGMVLLARSLADYYS